MKSAATTLFSLLLLSALISSYLPSTTAVIDTEGNPLYNRGVAYYILPAFRGIGGGIELAKVGNETCPLSVAQARSPLSEGAPLIISSPYLTLHISDGWPVQLSFTSVPTCSQNSSWWTNVEGSIKIFSPEDNIWPGWFHIEKYSISYKLVYCPRPTGACKDVVIHVRGDGIRTLALKNENEENPFVVKFKKANDSSFATDA